MSQTEMALKKTEMYATENQKLVESVSDFKYECSKQQREIEHLRQQLEVCRSNLVGLGLFTAAITRVKPNLLSESPPTETSFTTLQFCVT